MKTSQSLASVIRQVGASALSAAYAALVAAGHTKGIPAAVDAVIVGFGPAVIFLEHYLSDPSTGTTNAPAITVTRAAVTPAVPADVAAAAADAEAKTAAAQAAIDHLNALKAAGGTPA